MIHSCSTTLAPQVALFRTLAPQVAILPHLVHTDDATRTPAGIPSNSTEIGLAPQWLRSSQAPTLPCLPTPSEEAIFQQRYLSYDQSRITVLPPIPYHPRPCTQQTPSATPLSTIDMIKLPGPQTDKSACRGHRPLKLKAKKATVLRAPRPHIQTTLT